MKCSISSGSSQFAKVPVKGFPVYNWLKCAFFFQILLKNYFSFACLKCSTQSCRHSGLCAIVKFIKTRNIHQSYCKTCLKLPLKRRPIIVFKTDIRLNAGQNYCRMQYFSPALRYHMAFRPLFCVLLSGRLR